MDFNTASNAEKDKIFSEVEDMKSKFLTNFSVEGKKFSEMDDLEKAIVYMQIVTGADTVTRDVNKYDSTAMVFPEGMKRELSKGLASRALVNETPYGVLVINDRK